MNFSVISKHGIVHDKDSNFLYFSEMQDHHCVKSVSGPYFPVFGMNQKNSVFWYILPSAPFYGFLNIMQILWMQKLKINICQYMTKTIIQIKTCISWSFGVQKKNVSFSFFYVFILFFIITINIYTTVFIPKLNKLIMSVHTTLKLFPLLKL